MSTTVTMTEAGLVQLPEAVRKLFHLEGETRLELEVQTDGIRLRPQRTAPAAPRLVRNQRGRLVIADGPALDENSVVQAIKADREERDEHILAFRDGNP